MVNNYRSIAITRTVCSFFFGVTCKKQAPSMCTLIDIKVMRSIQWQFNELLASVGLISKMHWALSEKMWNWLVRLHYAWAPASVHILREKNPCSGFFSQDCSGFSFFWWINKFIIPWLSSPPEKPKKGEKARAPESSIVGRLRVSEICFQSRFPAMQIPIKCNREIRSYLVRFSSPLLWRGYKENELKYFFDKNPLGCPALSCESRITKPINQVHGSRDDRIRDEWIQTFRNQNFYLRLARRKNYSIYESK